MCAVDEHPSQGFSLFKAECSYVEILKTAGLGSDWCFSPVMDLLCGCVRLDVCVRGAV